MFCSFVVFTRQLEVVFWKSWDASKMKTEKRKTHIIVVKYQRRTWTEVMRSVWRQNKQLKCFTKKNKMRYVNTCGGWKCNRQINEGARRLQGSGRVIQMLAKQTISFSYLRSVHKQEIMNHHHHLIIKIKPPSFSFLIFWTAVWLLLQLWTLLQQIKLSRVLASYCFTFCFCSKQVKTKSTSDYKNVQFAHLQSVKTMETSDCSRWSVAEQKLEHSIWSFCSPASVPPSQRQCWTAEEWFRSTQQELLFSLILTCNWNTTWRHVELWRLKQLILFYSLCFYLFLFRAVTGFHTVQISLTTVNKKSWKQYVTLDLVSRYSGVFLFLKRISKHLFIS